MHTKYNTENNNLIARTIHLKKGQHRYFTVTEHKYTCTILTDQITKETYVYKKLYRPIGDTVIIFIENINLYDPPRLSYSVLNDYEEDKDYVFDVLKEKENGYLIESNENIQLFIPKGFEQKIENKTKVRLRVKTLDTTSNKVFFYNTISTIESQEPVDKIFSIGKTYEFSVIGKKTISETINIIELNFKGHYFTVKAYDFQLNQELPKTIVCYVKNIEDDKVYLAQNKYNLLCNLYKENTNYNFKIESLEIDGEYEYFLLSDQYNFNHKVFVSYFTENELSEKDLGSTRSFHVRKINEKGYLELFPNTDKERGKFFSIEQVLEDVGLKEKVNDYFYHFKVNFKENDYSNFPFSNLFYDYKNKENLWFFSYLAFVNFHTNQLTQNKEYIKANEFLRLYITLEQWMLEGSSFLSNFSRKKRDNIIEKAESQILKAKEKNDAINLIQRGKAEQYIQDTRNKINKSGYLRSNSLNILKAILFISDEIIEKNTNEIVEIIVQLYENNVLDKFDCQNFIGILEKKNIKEKFELNHSLTNKDYILENEDETTINNIVLILMVQLLLNKNGGNKKNAAIYSASLYRYLSYKTPEIKTRKRLLSHAINCITNEQVIQLDLSDVKNFNLDNIIKNNPLEKTELSSSFQAHFLHKQNGAIFKSPYGWALLSPSQYYHFANKQKLNVRSLANFFDNRIIVATPLLNIHTKLTNLKNVYSYANNWDEYFNKVTLKDITDNSLKSKNIPTEGITVNVVAKNYFKNDKTLLFVRIIDEQFYGHEGIIAIKEISRIRFDGIDKLINPGDRFRCKVIKNNDRLNFTIIDQVWKYMKNELRENEIVEGKVVDKNEVGNYIITEKGCFAYCDDPNLLVNKTYRFKVIGPLDNYKTYTLKFISPTDSVIDEKTEFRTFLEKYILETNDIDEEDLIDKEHDIQLYIKKITELIWSIESLLSLEEDNLKKAEIFFLLKFLTSIIRSSKSYYFEAHINYLKALESFKTLDNSQTLNSINLIEDKTIKQYPSLNVIQNNYHLLKCFNNKESNQELFSISSEANDDKTKKLAQLILAHNLMASNSPEHHQLLFDIKKLIYEEIANDNMRSLNELSELSLNNPEPTPIVEEVLNLGNEGKYREFKTSFIYFAGSARTNIERQSEIIMKTIAGFLNADGGSLFIGVNDSGDIIGLNNDYQYFEGKGNSDIYERFIRKYIVSSFNKDVNSQIEFVFAKSHGMEYVEIIIPRYEKPIPLANDFYQRQGNETRILKGNDLVLFFERRMGSEKNSIIPSNSSKNQIVKNDSAKLEACHENKREKIDFYEDTKKDNNTLKLDQSKSNYRILTYLHFYHNGSFMLSKFEKSEKDTFHSLPITSNVKNGFLLQAYDNGCVNKVEIRSILSKKLGYNYSNAFSKEGNLIFLKIIKEDCLLQIRSLRKNIEYVKIINTNVISTHRFLHLKGNNMLQCDFDMIKAYAVITNSFANNLSRITYTSKQSIGKNINNESFKNEVRLLNSISPF